MNDTLYLPERQAVIDACIALADLGFLAGTGGNLALRIDAEHFAVTPSASDYYTLIPTDIAVLRLADLQQVTGSKKPSVESALHATMLRQWPQHGASVHTHQPLASAVALLNRPLPLSDPRDIADFGPEIGITRYGPSGTGFLRKALQQALRPELHAYLLGNHGLICICPTLADAAARLQRIEEAARHWLHQSAQQAPTHRVPPALRQFALPLLAD